MRRTLECVQRQEEECISCFRWSGRTFICPYHVHPEIELNYIAGSSGRRLVGDCLDEFKPGDLVLLGPGLPHMYFHNAPADAADNWARSLYIQFLPDCLGQEFFALPGMKHVHELLARAKRGLSFPRFTARKVLPLLHATMEASGARRIAMFLQLLETLAEARGAKPLASMQFGLPQLPQSSKQLELATSYIHRHLFEQLTLSATARHAHMSPQGFSRFFHKHMRRTFLSYVTDLRIGNACQMLLESNLTVAEICFASGFNNLSNFNRQFRATKAMSPRQFRRQSTSHGL